MAGNHLYRRLLRHHLTHTHTHTHCTIQHTRERERELTSSWMMLCMSLSFSLASPSTQARACLFLISCSCCSSFNSCRTCLSSCLYTRQRVQQSPQNNTHPPLSVPHDESLVLSPVPLHSLPRLLLLHPMTQVVHCVRVCVCVCGASGDS